MKNKIVSLQVLRAISFFMIFFFHAHIGSMGAIAVSIFFVLSGFVIMYSYKEDKKNSYKIKECINFSINKIKKLYPLHIIMMIIVLLFELTILIIKKKYISPINWIIKLLFNITLLQSLIPNDKIIFSYNGVAWYLSASLFIYMFFPKIWSYLKKNNSKKRIILNIILTFTIQIVLAIIVYKTDIKIPYTNRIDRWFTYIFPLFRLGDFFIGCNLGLLYKNYYNEPKIIKSTILEIISIIAIIISQYIYCTKISFLSSDSFRYTIINIPIAIILVYIFSYNKGIITNLLSKSKILIKIGNISGYLFLIHQVIILEFDTILKSVPSIKIPYCIVIILEFLLSYMIAEIYVRIIRKNIKDRRLL